MCVMVGDLVRIKPYDHTLRHERHADIIKKYSGLLCRVDSVETIGGLELLHLSVNYNKHKLPYRWSVGIVEIVNPESPFPDDSGLVDLDDMIDGFRRD